MRVTVMNRRKFSLLLLVCAAGTLAACSQGNTSDIPATTTMAPEVSVAQARAADEHYVLNLPARAVADETAHLHARATGFVSERLADLGDRVNAGQVLARIATPEADQVVREAEASLEQARANLLLAQANYERAATLIESDSISQEMYNERSATHQAAIAAEAAAQARLDNARERQSFQTIRAPFDGLVAARNVERGDRVVGDAATVTAPLFAINVLDPLRILVDVPQSAALQVHAGMKAEVRFRERPGEVFQAEVIRSAHAISEQAGGMRIELRLPNPGERLPAGMMGSVRLNLARLQPAVMVPLAAIVRQGSGDTLVARLEESDNIRYQPVVLGRNLGNEVEVLSGIHAGDTVILAPNALLADGAPVRLRSQQPDANWAL